MHRLHLLAILAVALSSVQDAARADPLSPASLKEITDLYQRLINAENRHDFARSGRWCGNRRTPCSSQRRLHQTKETGPASGAWTS